MLGSGPRWVATPSSWWTRATYSLPVSRRTQNEFGWLRRASRRSELSNDKARPLDEAVPGIIPEPSTRLSPLFARSGIRIIAVKDVPRSA